MALYDFLLFSRHGSKIAVGFRWGAIAAAGLAYVRLRSRLAVKQLVSIYRKVTMPVIHSGLVGGIPKL